MKPLFIVVDLFCGAGGTTTGIVKAMFNGDKIAKVIAAVNHDHQAILSHWANHPEIKHFEEDIRALDLSGLVELVNHYRKLYPDAYLVLWASLECTNMSKAKGGLAKDEDSRTLANTLYMKWNEDLKEYEPGLSYIQLLQPDYIWIENVVEFKQWGPTEPAIRNGKPVMIKNKHGEVVPGYWPIKELKGIFFDEWRKSIDALGYRNEWTELDSADYGAFTKRNRLFGCFAKDDLPIVWPTPTHHKTGANGLLKHKAVKEKIDFSDKGYDILHRGRNKDIPKRQRKDLSLNSLERVYEGCIKQIAGGKKAFEAFLIKYHGHKKDGEQIQKPRTKSIDEPLNVIDTQNRHAVVQFEPFIVQRYSGKPQAMNIGLDRPARTITSTGGNQDLITPESLDGFISVYHGNGDNSHSLESPGPVIPTADINAVVFINRDFSGGGTSSSAETPLGAIPTVPKANVVTAELAFIDGGQYENCSRSIEQPLNTITADRHYPYILQYQFGGQSFSVENACPTIIASTHKEPIYLVTAENGDITGIRIFEDDPEIVVKIKEFMVMYRIKCIKMRGLKIPELLQIQGFPADYKLAGTQEAQKKFIGNSVVPEVPCAMVTAYYMHFKTFSA